MFIKRSTKDLWVKGAVGGRSKITSEEGRLTWVELFPFPEVTAKYGHGARNRYFPALCRDCAISRLGRGALETYCISSPRERVIFALGKLLPESGVQITRPAL